MLENQVLELSDKNLEFEQFKRDYKISCVVAVIGGSCIKNGRQDESFLETGFKKASKAARFAVLTGGTSGGIPELALRVARSLELPTIGIYPAQGRKHVRHELLDFSLEVPKPVMGDVVWGSETSVLVSAADTVVVFGGGWGTVVEVGMVMKNNLRRVRHGITPALLVVVENTGGLADNLTNLISSIDTVENTVKKAGCPEALADILIGTMVA